MNEVVLQYWRFAETYYAAPDGGPGRELDNIKLAVKPLKELYGLTSAIEFGPLSLKAVREKMIQSDLRRGVINQRIGYIKRIFKWAASEELVPAEVFHALQSVDGLRRGRTTARETEPVRPVPDAYVDAVLPFPTWARLRTAASVGTCGEGVSDRRPVETASQFNDCPGAVARAIMQFTYVQSGKRSDGRLSE